MDDTSKRKSIQVTARLQKRNKANVAAQLLQLEDAFNEASKNRENALRSVEEARQHLEGVETEMSEKADHLSSLLKADRAGITMRNFPPSVQTVAQLVAANGGLFHRTPIGPLGLHLVVKDPRWLRAVNEVIGTLMDSFLVHDHHDASELWKLMKDNGINSNSRLRITITSFDAPLYTIPADRVPDVQIPTVLRMLKCKDARLAVVMNCIVDLAGVESLALAQNYDAARAVFRSENVRACFTAEGRKLSARGPSETLMNPRWNGPQLLGIDLSEIQRRAELDLACALGRMESARQSLETEEQGLVEACERFKAALVEKERYKDLEEQARELEEVRKALAAERDDNASRLTQVKVVQKDLELREQELKAKEKALAHAISDRFQEAKQAHEDAGPSA